MFIIGLRLLFIQPTVAGLLSGKKASKALSGELNLFQTSSTESVKTTLSVELA